MARVAVLLSTAALALLASARPAAANGVNTHTWISLHALEHLPDGELKRLLSDPAMRSLLINGSYFPDGGYAVRDDFGEMAHWEPFVDAYLTWMQRELPFPYARGDARPHVAFLMGVASHGMADQVFDATFMKAARGYDAAGWSDELLDSFDTATDVLLVEATGVDFRGETPWVPADELAPLFDGLGHTVAPQTLRDAQIAMHDIVLTYGAINGRDPVAVERYRTQYPWAAGRLMDEHEPGSPPCEGEVVAAYWLALWDRLHDVDSVQNQIIATYPRADSDGHPTAHAMVEAQVVVVFGHGVDAAQLADKFTVEDATGKTYAIEVDPWSGDVGNLVRLVPQEDWAADQTFTVTIAAGIRTLDGVTYDQPWSFAFSTRPAPGPRDPTSDPTPHTGEPWTGPPDPEPEKPDDGGCVVGGGAGLGAALALIALRRRRTSAARRAAGRDRG